MELIKKTLLNQSAQPATIQTNIPLHDKNWFQTGGPAKFFAEPTNAKEFIQALDFAQSNHLNLFILGQGANIIISDEGFNGLVIRPGLRALVHTSFDNNQALVTAGAGVTIDALINYCLDHNLLGLEEFSGIPGTVGGSVYINLHYYDFLLSQFLVNAQVLNKKTKEVLDVTNDWFNFGYNTSTLLEENHYLLSATFKVKRCTDLEAAYARGRRTEIIRHRVKRYPSVRTCGSFFRNFHEDEVNLVINGKKMIYVAYYLDKIGIKGALSFGDAIVSYQHANMIVNQGKATTADIIALARAIQEKVYEHYGIIPQSECRLIGFKEYPLL